MDCKIVMHNAEEGGYWAEIPALSGCVSEGDMLEEVRRNIVDAAMGCIEASLRWAASHAAATPSSRRTSARRSLVHA